MNPTASRYPLVVISLTVYLEKCHGLNYSVYHSPPHTPTPGPLAVDENDSDNQIPIHFF